MISKTAVPPTRQQSARTQRDSEKQRLFSTKNDLPQETRVRVAALLNMRLADCIDLQSQCKQAHWNVKGPSFIGLHKLFDDINTDVEEYVDLLAETIASTSVTARCPASRCPTSRPTTRAPPGS